MSLTPEQIAQELKTYSFFNSFDELLLAKIARHLKEAEYPQGHILTQENQMVDSLYFLRSGSVDVLVQGEKVAELRKAGDLIGELSSLSKKPSTAMFRVHAPLRCYTFSYRDFVDSDSATKNASEIHLNRLYISALTERVVSANDKARLYEATARELALKAQELEEISSAQDSLNHTKADQRRKTVLLVEPNKKQQNILKTSVGGGGVDLLVASSVEQAKELYLAGKPDLIFCDSTLTEFLFWAQQQSYTGESVLLESGRIDFNRLATMPFVSNVVSRDLEDKVGTAKSILTSLSKILHNDYFGLEKYLAWGTEVHSISVTGSKDRSQCKEKLREHFSALGVRNPLLDRVEHAAEEMLMNAIYDAPVDAEGTSLFNHLPRTTEIVMNPTQRPTFRFGCDGNMIAISVQDPFGSLPRYVMINYIESCYENQGGEFNRAKGGAGLGLHQILETCDRTIFNIKPGQSTEVIGLFHVDQKQTTWPQFHYFFLK